MKKLILKVDGQIDNIDTVLIDIFDTILTRSVDPEYVKKIWASFICNIYSLRDSPELVYKKRRDIEAHLCSVAMGAGLDSDFRYEEMVLSLYKNLCSSNDISVDYADFLSKCIETEVAIESNVLTVDADVMGVIKNAKDKNKKIICVSDMYLSKDMISTIFDNLGISLFIDDIYVSSYNLRAKKSGRLYIDVLRDLNIVPERCIMIGDNQYSDYAIPKSLSIDSLLIDRTKKKEEYSNYELDKSNDILLSSLKDLVYANNREPFVGIVFSLYMFTERLYFRLIEQGVKDIVFFAREGEYLKKLFDEYQKTIFSRKIRTHYLYVSRKATYLPSLGHIKSENFSVLFRAYGNISVEMFLKSLNFNENEISQIRASTSNQIKFDNVINNFAGTKEFLYIVGNQKFQSIYNKKRSEQKKLFKEYINQLELMDDDELHIVDVGWKGTIQNNIQNIITDRKVIGHYLGLSIYGSSNMENKEGLLFANYPNVTKNFRLFNENRPIFEIILGASHGASEYYYRQGGVTKVKTQAIEKEKTTFKEIIHPIQSDMFQVFCQIKEMLQNKAYDIQAAEKIFNKAHFRMMFCPSRQELICFANICHYENFGLFSFTEFNNKNRLSVKQRTKEYLRFIFRNNQYVSEYYWCQLKNYNNGLKFLMKIYSIERYLNFKRKNII